MNIWRFHVPVEIYEDRTAQSPLLGCQYRTGLLGWNAPAPQTYTISYLPAHRTGKENSSGIHFFFQAVSYYHCRLAHCEGACVQIAMSRARWLFLLTSLPKDLKSQKTPQNNKKQTPTHWWFSWVYGSPPSLHPILGSCVHGVLASSVGNLSWEPMASQLLLIKMYNWISHVFFRHCSGHALQATV